MNNIAKVLLGIGAVGAVVGVTAHIVKKNTEKKYATVDVSEQAVINDHKDDSILKKIKNAAIKKVTRILAWVIVHKEQIEAVGTVLGVAASIFSVVNAVKEYNMGKELHRKLDSLVEWNTSFEDIWEKTIIANNDNLKTYENFMNDVMKKLEDMHLDMSMLHEIHESLIPYAA